MKKKFSLYILLFLITLLQITNVRSASIDEKVNEVLSPISNKVAGIVFYSINFGDFSFPLILVFHTCYSNT